MSSPLDKFKMKQALRAHFFQNGYSSYQYIHVPYLNGWQSLKYLRFFDSPKSAESIVAIQTYSHVLLAAITLVSLCHQQKQRLCQCHVQQAV